MHTSEKFGQNLLFPASRIQSVLIFLFLPEYRINSSVYLTDARCTCVSCVIFRRVSDTRVSPFEKSVNGWCVIKSFHEVLIYKQIKLNRQGICSFEAPSSKRRPLWPKKSNEGFWRSSGTKTGNRVYPCAGSMLIVMLGTVESSGPSLARYGCVYWTVIKPIFSISHHLGMSR